MRSFKCGKNVVQFVTHNIYSLQHPRRPSSRHHATLDSLKPVTVSALGWLVAGDHRAEQHHNFYFAPEVMWGRNTERWRQALAPPSESPLSRRGAAR